MKKSVFLLILTAVCSMSFAVKVERSFYFDFGNSKNQVTESPDANGNHWNNVTGATAGESQLINDAKGAVTTLSIVSTTKFESNGASAGGGLLEPAADLLGDLAVATATQDYLFASQSNHYTFTLTGLDPLKGYQFKIFGSRSATDVRIAEYTLRGAMAVQGSLQVAGTGIGGDGVNQNNSNVYLSPVIRPSATGEISLTVHRQYAGSGPYFPINCMRMQELTELNKPDKEIYIDCGHNDGTNGELTLAPDANGIYWVNLFDVAASASPVELTYKDGTKVNGSANVTIKQAFQRNGYKNGGNTAETYSALLGAFGQKTVAGDYFFVSGSNTGKMSFNALNPDKAYIFYIYGSRAYNSSFGQTVDKLKFEGLNTVSGTHHTGGNGLCYSGATNGWNEDAFYVSDPVFPAEDGSILLSLSAERGSYVHINAMRIEEYSDYEKPIVKPVAKYSELYLTGTAVEGGKVKMHLRGARAAKEGTSFEAYLNLTNAGSIQFEDKDGVVLSSAEFGLTTGIYRVIFDTETAKYTTLAISRVGLVGNIVQPTWNPAGEELAYIGDGVWSANLDLVAYTGSDMERGEFCLNSGWDYQFKMYEGEEGTLCLQSDAAQAGDAYADIPMRHGKKIVTFNLRDFTYSIECVEETDNKITFFGSSVCNGQGADNMQGYAYQYGQLLANRYDQNSELTNFEYSNASVNGNNTLNLLARFNGHLTGDCGEYVVIGLGLGNEGLHEAANKQAVYDQWKTNMQLLITKAQAEGKTVVATNNYPRGDYNADDYSYVKRMNLEMHEWDIPTVNFLGALDNLQGNGQWADGYQVANDIYHPTTEGHTEFMHTIVPSLFESLEAGKVKPTRQTGEGMKLDAADKIVFLPEDQPHSFTMAMRIKTDKYGKIGVVHTTEGDINIELPQLIADNNWHTLIMTHYYAAGKVIYYFDGVQVDVKSAQILLKSIEIGGVDMQVADLMFYRAGMNQQEVVALVQGKMLCSSLELYAPLNNNETTNFAQSTNEIILVKQTPTALQNMQNEEELSQSYNLLGQPVGKNHKGIVISKNHKQLIVTQ